MLLSQMIQEPLLLLVHIMVLIKITLTLDLSKLPSNSMDGVVVIVSMVVCLKVSLHSHV